MGGVAAQPEPNMSDEQNKPEKKTLFIIDVMPFLYRGHFVFLRNPRVTSTGITTSAAKRSEYLAWAAARDAILIEDDFDSEFSASRKPTTRG